MYFNTKTAVGLEYDKIESINKLNKLLMRCIMSKEFVMTQESIQNFCDELYRRERSTGTIAQYRCSLKQLHLFLPEDKRLNREYLLIWKERMTSEKAIQTVNCMIAAVNSFLDFVGLGAWRLKSLKCQRRIFSEDELTREEFQSLVRQADQEGDLQTVTLLQAMSGTGIRVSEVRFLTVEAAKSRMAVVRLKGKTRQVPLGEKLCAALLRFARKQGIQSGAIFLGKNGRPLDRRRIWERMKHLCRGAGVDPRKVHPHALRHLFARMFYELTRDIAKLADLLGHGSVETTRIYIMTSCHEHRSILDRITGRLSIKKPSSRDGEEFWT